MSISERPVALVARREITEGFRSKGFWILLGVSLVAVAAIIVIANLAGGTSESTDRPGSRRDTRPGDCRSLRRDRRCDRDDDRRGDRGRRRRRPRRSQRRRRRPRRLLDGAATIVVEQPIDADDDSDLAAVVNVLRSDIALTEGLAEAGLSDRGDRRRRDARATDRREPRARRATRTPAAGSGPPSSSTSPCSCCCRRTAAGWSVA